MELSRKACRCCRASAFERQNLWAEVDPFFARHGLQIDVDLQIDVPLYDWGIRRKVDRLPASLAASLHRRLDSLRSSSLLVSQQIRIAYGICKECHFLAPWFEIGDDQLSDYYAFYLKDEYKQARTSFQPGFAQLGQLMGSSEESDRRREQHETYILPYLQTLRSSSPEGNVRVLDYGGGEGMITPRAPWIHGSVHEVGEDSHGMESTESPFDFVQCLHVLEHVGHPWRIYQQLIDQCRSGGLIYVEVPIEFPGMDMVRAGNLPICHEHINKFCLEAIQALLRASPVEEVVVETGSVDFLHLEGMTPVIRGLARKL